MEKERNIANINTTTHTLSVLTSCVSHTIDHDITQEHKHQDRNINAHDERTKETGKHNTNSHLVTSRGRSA